MLNGLQDMGADGDVIEGKLKWGIVTGSIIIQTGVTNTKLLNKLLAQLKFIGGIISIVMPAASVRVQPLSTIGAARTTAQPLPRVPATYVYSGWSAELSSVHLVSEQHDTLLNSVAFPALTSTGVNVAFPLSIKVCRATRTSPKPLPPVPAK